MCYCELEIIVWLKGRERESLKSSILYECNNATNFGIEKDDKKRAEGKNTHNSIQHHRARWRTVSHSASENISVLLSEIYCTYHVTDATCTAVTGLWSLLVRPPGTVSWTLSATRTVPKLPFRRLLKTFLFAWY